MGVGVGRGLGCMGARVISKTFRIWGDGEGQTFWSRIPRDGYRFFITTKSLLHGASIKPTLKLIISIKIQTLWRTETAFAYN